MSYRRHNRVLIGGKSLNLGDINLLVTKRKGGITPQNVSLLGQQRADLNWDLSAIWLAPKGTIDMPNPTGYSIELQQMIVNPPTPLTWVSLNTVAGLTTSYPSQPEGVYKVRVRTEFAGSQSEWVESNVVYAFVNVSFDFSGAANAPHFHLLTGKGHSSSG